MEGKINFACLDDNSKELDYGTIDGDIEASFYSSKLVIDFSKEDSPSIELHLISNELTEVRQIE